MIVKNIKKICAVIIILIFISVSTFLIDSCLAEDNKSPIFSFPYAHINDGGSDWAIKLSNGKLILKI